MLTISQQDTVLRALNLMESECKELISSFSDNDSSVNRQARRDLVNIEGARKAIEKQLLIIQ